MSIDFFDFIENKTSLYKIVTVICGPILKSVRVFCSEFKLTLIRCFWIETANGRVPIKQLSVTTVVKLQVGSNMEVIWFLVFEGRVRRRTVPPKKMTGLVHKEGRVRRRTLPSEKTAGQVVQVSLSMTTAIKLQSETLSMTTVLKLQDPAEKLCQKALISRSDLRGRLLMPGRSLRAASLQIFFKYFFFSFLPSTH